MGAIHYRAIQSNNRWRKVNSHESMENALGPKRGVRALFAGRIGVYVLSQGKPAVICRDLYSH